MESVMKIKEFYCEDKNTVKELSALLGVKFLEEDYLPVTGTKVYSATIESEDDLGTAHGLVEQLISVGFKRVRAKPNEMFRVVRGLSKVMFLHGEGGIICTLHESAI
jgi:hypothetical protein